MARTENLDEFLTDVADAIRTKSGSSDSIQASSFDTAILGIPSGTSVPEIIVSTKSADDKGTSSTKALDLTDLKKGAYIYMNYSSATSFYTKLTPPNSSTAITKNFSNSNGYTSQVGASSATWFEADVVMYNEVKDWDSLANNTLICEVTLRYCRPPYTGDSNTKSYAQTNTWRITKSNSTSLSALLAQAQVATSCLDSKLSTINSTASNAAYEAQQASSTASNAYNIASGLSTTVSSLDRRVSDLEKSSPGEEEVATLIATGSSTPGPSGDIQVYLTPEQGDYSSFSWTCSMYQYESYVTSINISFSSTGYNDPVKTSLKIYDSFDTLLYTTTLMLENSYSGYVNVPSGSIPYSGNTLRVEVYSLTGGEIYKTYGEGYITNFNGTISNWDNTGPLEIYEKASAGVSHYIGLQGSSMSGTTSVTLTNNFSANLSNAYLEVKKVNNMDYTEERVALLSLGDITQTTHSYTFDSNDFAAAYGYDTKFFILYEYSAGSLGKEEVKLSEVLIKCSQDLPSGSGSSSSGLPVYEVDFGNLFNALKGHGVLKNDLGSFALKAFDYSGISSSSRRYINTISGNYILFLESDSLTFDAHVNTASYSDSIGFETSGWTVSFNFDTTAFGSSSGSAFILEKIVYLSYTDKPSLDSDYYKYFLHAEISAYSPGPY